MRTTKDCKHCGKRFKPRKFHAADHVFCSANCCTKYNQPKFREYNKLWMRKYRIYSRLAEALRESSGLEEDSRELLYSNLWNLYEGVKYEANTGTVAY